jgi:type 1 glutamine amidotransferase
MIKNLCSVRNCIVVLLSFGCLFQTFSAPLFKAIMWSVNDPWHFFMQDAKAYIQQLGVQYNFQADYSEDLTQHTDAFLSQYQLYINLNIEVTPLTAPQKTAFENFINAGKGWVGFHMAGNNKQIWPWYDAFLGGCRFTGHPNIQRGTINVEDTTHPASKHLQFPKWQVLDEFYEWDKSPRPNVRVLASLDEKTYKPAMAMSDHPYIWYNKKYPRTIFIGLGHRDSLWTLEPYFRNLVRDAILWAGKITTAIGGDPAPAATARLTMRVNRRTVSFSPPAKNFSAILTDATGRTVALREASNGACSFDRALLHNGVYFIRVTYGAGRITERIILP